VRENLVATALARNGKEWSLEKIYALFPRLAERETSMGNQLSGGEQQMLAVGRALVGNPELLLLDEPFEGLAPVIVEQLIDGLDRIRRASPLSIILVEHHAELALDVVETALVLDRGQVVWQGGAAALRDDPEKLGVLIGLEEERTPRAS
jgi:branched-chain amino acid transport system ATP-binding protein